MARIRRPGAAATSGLARAAAVIAAVAMGLSAGFAHAAPGGDASSGAARSTGVGGPGAAVSVVDDSGATLTLAHPARRVISLAPHTTELAYAAGGGQALVGAVAYSDFPAAAKSLPRVGDSRALDMERIAALKPDLALVWWHGTPPREIAQLRALGIPVFLSEPRTFADIASTIDRLGTLFGTPDVAAPAAAAFRQRIASLRARYADRPQVSVFYQVWSHPLFTLISESFVSDAITLCGGRNIFAGLAGAAPIVSTEAVVKANPEAIVTTTGPDAASSRTPAELARWRAWPRLTAVSRGNLFSIDADLISRPGPRLAAGAARLCELLQTARERRPIPPAAVRHP